MGSQNLPMWDFPYLESLLHSWNFSHSEAKKLARPPEGIFPLGDGNTRAPDGIFPTRRRQHKR